MNRRQVFRMLPLAGLSPKLPPNFCYRLGISHPKFWFGELVLSPWRNTPDDDKLEVWTGEIVGVYYSRICICPDQYGWHYALRWVDGPQTGKIEECDFFEDWLAEPGTPKEILEKIAT
ncbi:MAG: hypothetical protein ACM37W_26950 [Actinomycetota bacterium]